MKIKCHHLIIVIDILQANTTHQIGVGNDIIRDLNRHANVVLDGVPDWEASDPASVARKLELDRRAKRQRIDEVG